MLGTLIYKADRWISRGYIRWFGERGGLLVLYLHHLFQHQGECESGVVDPQQRMTVTDFRRLFEYYLANGYTFVGPEDLASLAPGRRYALVTFDDGYFNNVRALPVLDEFRAPAVFFIATGHVAANKPFWNDVLYREGRQHGKSTAEMHALGESFKRWHHDRVDRELERLFGQRAQQTVSDLDRPLTPDELRDFSRHRWVRLGNHTVHHAGLPFYDAAGRRAELDGAQAMLGEWTGRRPDAIGYPYGMWNQAVVQSARDAGLRLGFTAVPEKASNPLDGSSAEALTIGRFLPYPGSTMERELEFFRSDLRLQRRAQRLRDWIRKRPPGAV